MPPLTDTVGFIDSQERQAHMTQQMIQLCDGPLRGDIEELDAACHTPATDQEVVSRVVAAVQGLCGDAVGTQRLHLVLHQTDQRRDHHRRSLHHQGRNLIAKAFPASCGHQHEGIISSRHVLDDRLLVLTERIISKIAF